jgi:hypothetical protein
VNDQNLIPFQKGYDPRREGGGRKPNKLKALAKEMDLSKSDVASIFLDLIGEKTEAELRDILRDKTQPWMIRAYIRALVEDFKTGRVNTVREMLEWNFGKSVQRVQLGGLIGTGSVQLTDEEREALKAGLTELIPGIVQAGGDGDGTE